MSKAQLRKEFLIKRKHFSNPETSHLICKAAAALPVFKHAKTVMVYLSSNYEVDTTYLLALAKRYGKTLCAPRVLNDTDMEAALIDKNGFCRGTFGIWEPQGATVSDIDLVFVPGVAFDKFGNRLGYGKGYYDRFLKSIYATTIGLAFSCQLANELPINEHDARLDMILTEEGLYR